MAKSVEIEAKKRRIIEIIEKTMNNLNFYKNPVQFEQMLKGEVVAVDYIKENVIITINFYPKENGDVVMLDRNAPEKIKLRITNALLANSLCW